MTVDYRNLPWSHRTPDGRSAESGMVESGIERPFPTAGLRPGDPPPPGSSRKQWAGRILLANDGSPFRLPPVGGTTGPLPQGVPAGVVVSTDDLDEPGILFVELRFAEPQVGTGVPGVWSPLTTFRVVVEVLKGMDEQSPATTDVYTVDSTGATGAPIQWLPISYVQARSLTITVRLDVAGGGTQAQWCEAVITQVATPQYGPAARGRTNIFGSGRAQVTRVLVDAADPGTLVAAQSGWRTGVLLHVPPVTVDEDAVDLLVRFGAPVASDRSVYSFVLVPGQTYEAFPEYFWGAIYARTAGGESGATAPLLVSQLLAIGMGG